MSSLSSQFSHMSETMSSPSDWPHFYPQNLSAGGHDNPSTTMFGGRSSDATVVTSTTNSHGSGNISPSGGQLSPEGRVAKPIRRRSRASRRTPTTLLNTDTTNFRAMVQQFTGYPNAHFATGSHPAGGGGGGGATNFNFGLGSMNPRGVMAAPSPSGYQLQFQQQLQQQQYQQQHQDYMLSLSNSSRANMDVSDHGFLMQGPRTSSSNENTQSNNYMF